MVHDSGSEEEEQEYDVTPVEELVVSVAERTERQERDEGEKNPGLSGSMHFVSLSQRSLRKCDLRLHRR